jgi:lipoprotein signal peptidase
MVVGAGAILCGFALTDDLGKGFGPVVISMLIVAFGRTWAFNIANCFWLICGAVLLMITFTFPKDEEALNKLLKDRAEDIKSS